jgi:hypothetical protein
MNLEKAVNLTDDDWFSQGLNDAWSRRPKRAHVEDPCSASQYDLGYSEGLIRHQPNVNALQAVENQQECCSSDDLDRTSV